MKGIQGRNSRQEPREDWSMCRGRVHVTDLLLLVWPACFLILPRTTSQRTEGTHVSDSSRKYNVPRDLPTGDIFSIEVPSSRVTPAYIRLTEKLTRTLGHYGPWTSVDTAHEPTRSARYTLKSPCALHNLYSHHQACQCHISSAI